MTPSAAGPADADDRPVLRILRGNPSAQDLAALVAVLSAVGGGARPATPRRVSQWASPARAVRAAPHHGRGAWRVGSWPH